MTDTWQLADKRKGSRLATNYIDRDMNIWTLTHLDLRCLKLHGFLRLFGASSLSESEVKFIAWVEAVLRSLSEHCWKV